MSTTTNQVIIISVHLWSPSYFMSSTIGNVSKEIVAQYIENQIQKALSTKK